MSKKKQPPKMDQEDQVKLIQLYKKLFTLKQLKSNIGSIYNEHNQKVKDFFVQIRKKYKHDFHLVATPDKFDLQLVFEILVDNESIISKSLEEKIEMEEYYLVYKPEYTSTRINTSGTKALKILLNFFENRPIVIETLNDNILEELSIILNNVNVPLSEFIDTMKRDTDKPKASETKRINKELKSILTELKKIDESANTNNASNFEMLLELRNITGEMLRQKTDLKALYFDKKSNVPTTTIKKSKK
jgi:hypothetical protein